MKEASLISRERIEVGENSDQNKIIILYTIVGFVFSLLFRVTTDYIYLFYLSSLISFFLLVSIIFIPLKYILYPLLILLISMPDITQSAEEVEEIGEKLSATPWQLFIGPITPAFSIFGLLLIAMYRIYLFKMINNYKKLFIYFIIIVTIVSIYFGYLTNSVHRFIVDAKVPMFFCISIIIFTSYFNRFPEKLKDISLFFFALCIGNYTIDFLKLLIGNENVTSTVGYSNLSLDSGKGMITVITFWALANILNGKKIIINFVLVAITVYVLLAFQTRWLIVTFFLGLIFVAVFLGIKRTIIVSIPLAIFLLIAIPVMIEIAPEVWRVTLLRFSFIENISTDATLADIELARAGSIYNSMNTLYEKKAFLTGMGYGSWFNDSYFPMPNLTISGFDEESLLTGKYYRVHDFTFHFLFKFGIIGIWLYAGSFFRPLYIIWKNRVKYRNDNESRLIAIILFGVTPMALTFMWFTAKGLMLCAFLIVIAYQWINFYSIKFEKRGVI